MSQEQVAPAETPRAKATRLFGSPDENTVQKWLIAKGWKLIHTDWFWQKPKRDYVASDEEWFAIQYLIDEFGFNGVRS